MNIHIETDRLIMRDIEVNDVDGMFALDSDPEVHRYLGNKPIKTKEEAVQSIEYIRQQYVDNGIGRWAVIDKSTKEFMGWSGLKYETELRKGYHYYDIGYRFIKKYWGKGIATETAVASLKYGFEKMKLEKICGAADHDNLASQKILQKIGLKFVETFHYDGVLLYWYEINKTEWLAAQAKD